MMHFYVDCVTYMVMQEGLDAEGYSREGYNIWGYNRYYLEHPLCCLLIVRATSKGMLLVAFHVSHKMTHSQAQMHTPNTEQHS